MESIPASISNKQNTQLLINKQRQMKTMTENQNPTLNGSGNPKREYVKPAMEIIHLETVSLLAGSTQLSSNPGDDATGNSALDFTISDEDTW